MSIQHSGAKHDREDDLSVASSHEKKKVDQKRQKLEEESGPKHAHEDASHESIDKTLQGQHNETEEKPELCEPEVVIDKPEEEHAKDDAPATPEDPKKKTKCTKIENVRRMLESLCINLNCEQKSELFQGVIDFMEHLSPDDDDEDHVVPYSTSEDNRKKAKKFKNDISRLSKALRSVDDEEEYDSIMQLVTNMIRESETAHFKTVLEDFIDQEKGHLDRQAIINTICEAACNQDCNQDSDEAFEKFDKLTDDSRPSRKKKMSLIHMIQDANKILLNEYVAAAKQLLHVP